MITLGLFDSKATKVEKRNNRIQQRNEKKRIKKEAREKRKASRREKSKIRAMGRWLKNIGTSSTEIFKDWFSSQDLVVIVNGELKYAKEVYEQNKGKPIKITPVKTIMKMGKEEVDRIIGELSDMYEEDYGGDLKADIAGHARAFIKGLKTGNLKEAYGKDLFESDEDIAFLFSDENDEFFNTDEGSAESYRYRIGDDIMSIRSIKEKYMKNIRIIASKESLDVLEGIPSLDEKIVDLKDKVEHVDEVNETTKVDEFSNEVCENKYTELRDEIYKIIKAVANNGKVEQLYVGPLSDILAASLGSRCNRLNIEDREKHEVEPVVHDVVEEVRELGAVKIADEVEHKTEELEDAIENEIADDKSYNPVLDEIEDAIIENGGFASVGEMLGRKRHQGIGENKGYGEDVDILGGAATVVDLFQLLFALPINILHTKNIHKMEKRYGSNFIIKQPMIVTNNMSQELAGKFSKALEIKYLLETKAILEATAAKADGGVVTSRARAAIKFLTPANIKFKDAKLYDNENLDYNEVIGVFSESRLLNTTSTDSLFLLPSVRSCMNREMETYDFMNTNLYPIGKGEAGEFIQHGRDALPSYMTVTIEYIAQKNVTNFNVDNKTRETMIGLQIIPRSLSGVDIVDTIADMDKKRFAQVKVTADERNFTKKMKNLLKFWKKKGTSGELKVLNSNAFADIVKKIESISTPLFHLVISMDEYVNLKNKHKVDIMSGATYREMMKALPLISISVVDEDTNLVYLSEGPVMNFYKHDIDEYIDSISQYEKDLKTIIKYNQYR